jgi:hypothetical protein
MKGGENEMMNFAKYQLQLVNERQERWIQEAREARRIERPPRPSIRRTVGGSIVRIGARLAGESPLELARSR